MLRASRRIALKVEYDGTDFVGWQVQASGRTVQGVLESVIREVLHETARVVGAGRTDSGVHARGQVAHIDLRHDLPIDHVHRALNSRLPPDVRVTAAAAVAAEFHARRDAVRRRYIYRLSDAAVGPVIDRRRIAHTFFRLNDSVMAEAAQAWLGRHDYTSFRAAVCQAESPIRSMEIFDIARDADGLIIFTVEARAFLHHQVRNMVGTLLEIGRGARPTPWAAEVLAARDRSSGGPTAPAHGLVLDDITYRTEIFAS